MTPTSALEEAAMKLLAADAATLAPATDANLIILVKSNFTEGGQTAIADLTEADFPGYAALAVGVGAQAEGTDPATGDYVIDLKDPVGGWRFETTGAVSPSQTIYGFALVDSTKATVLASHKFDVPYVLTANNQFIDLGDLPSLTLAKGTMV